MIQRKLQILVTREQRNMNIDFLCIACYRRQQLGQTLFLYGMPVLRLYIGQWTETILNLPKKIPAHEDK